MADNPTLSRYLCCVGFLLEKIKMNKDLIQKLKELYGEHLSDEEIQEDAQNVISFFEILIEIDRRNKRQQAC